MEGEIAASISNRTCHKGECFNNRLSQTPAEEVRGHYKRVEYPASGNQKARARPNRNSVFHAVTRIGFLLQ